MGFVKWLIMMGVILFVTIPVTQLITDDLTDSSTGMIYYATQNGIVGNEGDFVLSTFQLWAIIFGLAVIIIAIIAIRRKFSGGFGNIIGDDRK
jgi:Ni/Fe-hydrogenase subunit HybB-like protein